MESRGARPCAHSQIAWGAVPLLALIVGMLTGLPAWGHGSMQDPISRVYACYLENPEQPQSDACKAAVAAGGTQPLYDWNEVNLPDVAGRHQAFIPDGRLCSAGRAKYAAFDAPRTDWPATTVQPGPYTFRFRATAPHRGYFTLHITRPGYDPSQPLTWAGLEEFATVSQPPLIDGAYQLTATIPTRSGRHLIYTIWQRTDSPEAFYTCSDVVLTDGAATPVPTGTPTPAGTATATATPGPTNTPTPTAEPPTGGARCQVDYAVVSQWTTGFSADVAITNLSGQAINGWQLEWSFADDQQVTLLWNGTIQQEGSTVQVHNASWNGQLPAGQSVAFGFNGSHQGSNRAPTQFNLNGMACGPAAQHQLFLPRVAGY